MRYPASEKLEIIRFVEQSHLSARRTLANLGIAKTTFYRWYDRYLAFGETGLDDRTSGPGRVWNRIPDDVRGEIVDLALEEPELSPRELAVRFTDTKGYFVSETSVYRILKAHDLITSPAFVVIKETSSAIKPRRRTNSGRPTSLTSRSSALVRRPFSTIIPAHYRLEALHHHGRTIDENPQVGVGSITTAPMSSTNRGCSATMGHPISPAIWPSGSKTRAWTTSGALSSKQMGLLSVFHKGGSGSSLFDVKPLGFDGSSGGFGWSVF